MENSTFITHPPNMSNRSKSGVLSGAVLAGCVAVGVFWPTAALAQRPEGINMPGKSYQGPLPDLTAGQQALAAALQKDVRILAGDIGQRNVRRYRSLVAAAEFLEKSLKESGYQVERQTYRVDGRECWNLIVETVGAKKPDEIVVVGAHYDSVAGAPGANDNGSGVVALLALARMFAGKKTDRTLRFVLFTNEEPPYFQTEWMGSLVYARRCKANRDNIVGMICLETIGYYDDAKGSQHYPKPLNLIYPSTGNFIGFVGNVNSGPLVRQIVSSFRQHTKFPSEGSALPGWIEGVGFSDHWSFWQVGYRAVMVTDTAFFRYPYYHTREDTPDKLDYERMARVVAGLEKVVAELASPMAKKASPAKKLGDSQSGK